MATMTAEAVAYRQDVKRGRSTARTAFHKNNGAGVAKLGNKPMTNKEIEARHGPVVTYEMGGFPSFEEFQAFPGDVKAEYLNNLMDKYDISLCHVSRYLFNKGDDGLKANLRNEYFGDDRVLKLVNYQKMRASTGLLQFQVDIENWRRKEKAAKAIDEDAARRKRDIIWNAEFVTYEEMKALPLDGQVNYINNLMERYKVSLTTVAKILFRVDQNALRTYFKGKGVYSSISKYKLTSKAEQRTAIDQFRDLVRQWRGEEPEIIETETLVAEEPKAETERDICESFDLPSPIDEQEPDEAPIDDCDVWDEEPDNEVSAEDEKHRAERDKLYEEYMAREKEWVPEGKEIKVARLDHHESAFISDYISTGLDEDELYALIKLYANKRVKVRIEITTDLSFDG